MAAAMSWEPDESASRNAAPSPDVAVVTGGIGGIGTAVCRALADAGNRVVATYLPQEAELAQCWLGDRRAEGYHFIALPCDVASYESSVALARTVESTVGPVGVLVNCAGITRDRTLAKMEPSQWFAVLRTNLDSAFNVTRNFIEGMLARRYGRIINISSVNGLKGQFGQTNYSSAKAGLLGFTRSLAREVAPHGVTVNAVAPGYVDTSMVKAIPEPIRESIVEQIPVGRLARPEEIARVVAFLAAEASGYITGATISVNGGLFMA
ncbi:MAG TPA: acetoacetyl-CoA reductase [Gemmatimonadales bacterium]|nr:acetoacetyl-CoA reductase [Gemmatimonadales bacterium]